MEIISGRVQSALKVVIYGPEGIGKSTFASKAPFPLFCDVEDSTTHMDVRRLPKPTSVQAIIDEARYVLNHPELCQTFVLDTADWAEALCREKVCAEKSVKGIEDIGYGKGFTYSFEEFGKILDALTDLVRRGINVIVTAHAIMRKFEQPDEMNAYDRWELKLNSSPKCSIANMLKEWADVVLFANYETFAVKATKESKAKAQGGQRVMYTQHHPCWDAKNRFGLPEKLPFDFSQIAHIFPQQAIINTQPAAVPPPVETIKPAASELPLITEPDPDLPFTGPETPTDGIPQALLDLMKMNNVTEEQITAVVAAKGYYPAGTRIAQYAPDFVAGCLIAAWEQVFAEIEKMN